LLLFGGDALSPSLISSVTRGSHIPPLFNALGVDYAVCGNHDFDFGTDRMREMRGRCKFPWLLSNILATENGNEEEPLAGAEKYAITTVNGVKVGIMGLAEEEWLECLTRLPDSTRYVDQAEVGRELCKKLRAEGCEVLIALTHSREPQDTYLAKNCPDLDLIIGGHDHDYYIRNVNGIPILHSGSEFRSGTVVQVTLHEGGKEVTGEDIGEGPEWDLHGRRVSVALQQKMVTKDIPRDEEMDKLVAECKKTVEEKMLKTLGQSKTEWDVTFKNCRTRESGFGTWLASLMREGYKADIAVICGGTLRSNDSYGPGEIKMGDVMKILPFPDTVTIALIRGKHLKEGLENGFSAYPSPEGRFPQVSGAVIEVDPSREKGDRIVKMEIAGEPFDPERLYRLATKPYLLAGGDGYEAFGKYEKLIVDDEGIPLATLIVNHFTELKVLNAMRRSQRVKNLVATAFTSNVSSQEILQAAPEVENVIRIIS